MSKTYGPTPVDIAVDARPLKMLYQRVGMSGRRLAALVGVDPSAICRYSSGERMPSVLTLTKLCRILGVAYFDIVMVTEENGTPVRSAAPLQRPRTAGNRPSGTRGHLNAGTPGTTASKGATTS